MKIYLLFIGPDLMCFLPCFLFSQEVGEHYPLVGNNITGNTMSRFHLVVDPKCVYTSAESMVPLGPLSAMTLIVTQMIYEKWRGINPR